MVTAYLGLGGNLDPERCLPAAAKVLAREFPGARFSPLYRSAAVGFEGPAFLNAVASIETALRPEQLVDHLHQIETALGRRREGARWSSRHIDIDLLLYGDLVQEQAPRLPRPELREAAHVLKPLLDLAPDLIDPESGRPLRERSAAVDVSGLQRIERVDWPTG